MTTAPVAMPEATPTQTAPTATPAAATAPQPYPAGTRTGTPADDAVLAALEAPSPDALKALFALTPAPCKVNPQSITNPPLCPAGVAAGTLVPVFRAMSCESVWPDYLEEILTTVWKSPRPLVAIYKDPTDYYSWLPAAEYALIIHTLGNTASGGSPAVVRVALGKVNGIAFGCGQPFEQSVAGVTADRFVLPPRP
jgi:hypothetical protein